MLAAGDGAFYLGDMAAELILIHGDDEFMVTSRAKELVAQAVPEAERDFALEIIDGKADTVDAAVSAVRQCHEAVATQGFLSQTKTVWFRDVNFLTDTVVGRSESTRDALARLVDYLRDERPEGHALIISSPKADKRYALFKLFKESGEVHEFMVPDKSAAAEKHAASQLQNALSAQGLKMNRAVQAAFLERVGKSTRLIVNELEKLAVYLGSDRDEVTLEDVQALTPFSREMLAWALPDAFGSRDMRLCLETVRSLIAQRESPIGLISVLEHRVRELVFYRQAMDAGWLVSSGRGGAQWGPVPAEIERFIAGAFARDPRNAHPYRVSLLARQAAGFTARELRLCQREIGRAHLKMVTSSLPPALTIELLLTRLLRSRRARKAS